MCSKKEYNDEPVEYCDNCLSLAIKEISSSSLFVCKECGTAIQNTTHIDNWNEIYKERYGKYFISKEDSEGVQQ